MLIQGGIISRNGNTLKTNIHSVCVHSDTPNSVEISEQICILLHEMKIKKAALPEFSKTKMNNYFFYGTLRSIAILEKVIGGKTDHLKITKAFAPKSELRLVINENFPVIIFGENYSGVEGIVVKGLRRRYSTYTFFRGCRVFS